MEKHHTGTDVKKVDIKGMVRNFYELTVLVILLNVI